jgi:hypothetical protein
MRTGLTRLTLVQDAAPLSYLDSLPRLRDNTGDGVRFTGECEKYDLRTDEDRYPYLICMPWGTIGLAQDMNIRELSCEGEPDATDIGTGHNPSELS